MAAVIGALRAELSATIARFQEDMKNAGAAVRDFATKAEAQGKRIQRIGQTMSLAITAPLVAFGVKSVQAAKESAQALGQVDAALKSTEHQAGRTIGQLQAAAKSLENISTFDDDDILKDVTTNLLKFGNVVGETFDKAQGAIVNMAARTGDLSSATQTIGRALNDPIQGINALTRAGVQFTTQEKEQIKTLVTSGRGVEAQALILQKLERAYGGAAKALRDATPTAALNQQWRELTEIVGGILINVLPPVIDLLRGIAEVFNAMSPEMQRLTVYVGLFAAALGPLTVLLGTLMRVGAALAPILVRLGIGLAALSAPVWAFVAAMVAVVAALVVFWNSVRKLLTGDFSAAWEEAKKTAREMWDDITSMFAKSPIKAPVEFTTPDGKAIKPGALNFNIPKDTSTERGTISDTIHVTPKVELSDDFWRGMSTDMQNAIALMTDPIIEAVRARRDRLMTAEDRVDLLKRGGAEGVQTPEEQKRERIARELEFRALDAEERIAELQKARREAEFKGETDKLEMISDQIIEEQQLAALIKETSVDQIRAQEDLQDAFEGFFADVTNEFMRMAKEGKFTFAGLREAIREMLFEAIVAPRIKEAGGILKDLVSAAVSAVTGSFNVGGSGIPDSINVTPKVELPGHATGGFVPPHEWAVAGERGPEPVFGGKTGLSVMSNDQANRSGMFGGQTIINQNFRGDVNSFYRSARQIGRAAKRSLQEA